MGIFSIVQYGKIYNIGLQIRLKSMGVNQNLYAFNVVVCIKILFFTP